MANKQQLLLGIASYTPEEYAKLLATAADSADLEETWEEWHQGMERLKHSLIASGYICVEVPIEIEALEAFCLKEGMQNNSETRSRYISLLLQQRQQELAQPIASKPRRKLKKKPKRR
jgi:hypothetical protein